MNLSANSDGFSSYVMGVRPEISLKSTTAISLEVGSYTNPFVVE